MSRLRDTIDQLERKLDKEGSKPLDRRLLLRQCLEEVRAEAWKEGHHEGMMDALDAQRAQERASEASDGN